tara:strand:+ start:121 stop:849 length:729 start_codon:yes stop_codon:yes gene_type:complete
MRKQANFDAGLARIGARHSQYAVAGSKYGPWTDPMSGIKSPDFTTEKYNFIDANKPEDDPELDALFKEAQIQAAKVAKKKKPKIISFKDALAQAPDPYTNKNFAKYIKSTGEILKEGVKHTKTYRAADGLTYFVYQYSDNTGFQVSTHWDDKDPIKPQIVQDPITIQNVPKDEINPDKTWFGVEDLGKLTVNDVINASDEQVESFMKEFVAGDKDTTIDLTGIHPDVLKKIEDLFNAIKNND